MGILFSIHLLNGMDSSKDILVRTWLCKYDAMLNSQKCCSQHSLRIRPFNVMALFMAAKTKRLRWKKMWLFCHFALHRDCGYLLEPTHRGDSNGYPKSMFYRRNKNYNVYPCRPYFFLYKSGVWGGQNYIDMFSWCFLFQQLHFSISRTLTPDVLSKCDPYYLTY